MSSEHETTGRRPLHKFCYDFVSNFIGLWKVSVLFSDFSSIFRAQDAKKGTGDPLVDVTQDQFTSAIADVTSSKSYRASLTCAHSYQPRTSAAAVNKNRCHERIQWSIRGPHVCKARPCPYSNITAKLSWICKKNCHPLCAFPVLERMKNDVSYELFDSTCSKRCWKRDREIHEECYAGDQDLDSDTEEAGSVSDDK